MSSKDKGKSDIFTALLKTVYPQKLSPDISVTPNFFVFWKLLAPDLHGKKISRAAFMSGNQQPAVTKFIWGQNGYLKREKDWVSEAFLAVYRPYVTLKEFCSCGNFSKNKFQNRGRYLFWRVFFDFVLKNIGLKEESRCNILDTSSIVSVNRVAMNLLCVKLETTWGPFVVFGRFSVWVKTVAIII